MDTFVATGCAIIAQKSLDIIEQNNKPNLDAHLAIAYCQWHEIASPGLFFSNQSWVICFKEKEWR
ncbi:MAG: hypothetical protein ACYDGL_13180 [Bellilinea sp.]